MTSLDWWDCSWLPSQNNSTHENHTGLHFLKCVSQRRRHNSVSLSPCHYIVVYVDMLTLCLVYMCVFLLLPSHSCAESQSIPFYLDVDTSSFYTDLTLVQVGNCEYTDLKTHTHAHAHTTQIWYKHRHFDYKCDITNQYLLISGYSRLYIITQIQLNH